MTLKIVTFLHYIFVQRYKLYVNSSTCSVVYFHMASKNSGISISFLTQIYWMGQKKLMKFLTCAGMLCMHSTILFDQFCQSVCPSIQCQYCIKRDAYIVALLDILIGDHSSYLSTTVQCSNWNPLSGALNTHGWEKFAILPEIAIYHVNGTR